MSDDLDRLDKLAEAAREYAQHHGVKTWTEHIFAALQYAYALHDSLERAGAELEELKSAIERVRAVHRKETRISGWEVCTHCEVGMLQDPVDWPCDTIAALDAGKETNE